MFREAPPLTPTRRSTRESARSRPVALATLLAAIAAACSDREPTPPSEVPEGPVVDGVRLRILSEDLEHPVAIAHVPGTSRFLIAERRGRIRVLEDGEMLPSPFLDLSDRLSLLNYEQGLLGLALHPDYGDNGFLYVNYTALNGDTHVMRYRVSADPTRADPSTETPILEVAQPGPRHNGGNLEFGPDGLLYIGMGEGDSAPSAQDSTSLLGALLRIDVDGGDPYAIPADNPFVETDGRDEIWAQGLRNPWRFSFDATTDRLLIGDVGESLWEEVNVAPADQPNLNYGWPALEGPECVDPEGCPAGTTAPVFWYGHDEGCAVIGGYVYRGSALPDLVGEYFYGDNCRRWLRSFDPYDPDGVRTWDFGEDVGTVFSFGVDEDGELYVLTVDGAYRLEPAG